MSQEALQIMSEKILSKMGNDNLKKVKSATGVVEISCNIVEESYRRLNRLSAGVDKKRTAVNLFGPVMEKLIDQGFLTPGLENKILEKLQEEDVENMVDDTIKIWKERVEKMKHCCFILRKLTREITKLEKITVDDD
jgi:hypothetical protein